MILIIPGRLPGTNEIIKAAKSGRGKYQPYAMMKEQFTNMIAWLAKQLPRFTKVNLTIVWYEPNEKRDYDNIMGGQKFIIDGLVKAGTIPNDSKRYINSITHKFEVDRKNPRIVIQIEEVE